MTPAEMAARLELERLGGLPRWQVKPQPRLQPPPVDTLHEVAERRRVLKEDYWMPDVRQRGAA